MSVIYHFIKATSTQPGGIVLVEASPQAVRAIAELGQPAALELKTILDTGGNAQSAVDYLKAAIGNDLAGTIKMIGSVAAGLAVGEAVAVVVTGLVAAYVALPYALLVGAVVGVGVGGAAGQKIYDDGWEVAYQIGQGISNSVNSSTTSALNWVAPRRDPLVLDLDGNGITTSGINPASPILFDHNADGTLTATGWISSGEAIVVRDLNGNGLIDSGRELFGDNTLLTHGPNAGQTAANGFAALADLDANAGGVADGKFDASDVAFSSVKLWKDLNQDGISQNTELFTFAQLGIQSISVSGSASNVDLGGGNTQTFSGRFIRTDGQTGTSGTAELAGSLLVGQQ